MLLSVATISTVGLLRYNNHEMIPIRLELKNFMSYGEDTPALDFSGMHTLCLSGENGHGKSALLDAMTWALWGESRAGKNKHDELVRIGADEMSVLFTFEMDGQRYRVVRKYSKKAGGRLWEFQQETPDQGLGAGWRALTGNNSGDTGKAIEKLLRMSYDTFLNSAYLRQGQADQFVKQTPTKRKEILADILDLSRYDQLEAKARDRARSANVEATDLERDISGIDAELKAEPELREQLAALEARFSALSARRDGLRAEWDAGKTRKAQLESQNRFAETLRAQIAGLDSELRDLAEDLNGFQAEAEAGRALLSRQDEICRDFEKLTSARARVGELEKGLDQFHRGRQAILTAKNELQAAGNEAQRRLDAASRDYKQDADRVKDFDTFAAVRAALAPRVAAADRSEEQAGPKREELKALGQRFTALHGEYTGLDWQVREWTRKIETLESQQGQCDVCSSPLPATKVADIQAGYADALALAQAGLKRVKAEANGVKAQSTAGEAELRALEDQARQAKDDRTRLAQAEQYLLEAEAVRRTLPNLFAVRAEAERVVREGEFVPEVRARIAKYEAALAKLTHVEADHAAVKTEIALLEASERLHIQLEHAQAALKAAEVGLLKAQKALATRTSARDAAQAQLQGLADVTAELARLDARAREIGEMERARSAEADAVSQETGRRQQTLARLEEQKVVRETKSRSLVDARYDQEVHTRLTEAFGKKGVQALIIENAIPELQEEANRLLDRLTDGDMLLHFDTLKEAKTKSIGPIETLEIKVSDNLGTRPLEMYSGGEGFRAAFALRIALSKLLARRAGARLQTLIIDEGFGSQDAKGREKLVECLDAIKDDFERIIVITHIDELKDAFATRVEVTKTPSGSRITVMEGSAG